MSRFLSNIKNSFVNAAEHVWNYIYNKVPGTKNAETKKMTGFGGFLFGFAMVGATFVSSVYAIGMSVLGKTIKRVTYNDNNEVVNAADRDADIDTATKLIDEVTKNNANRRKEIMAARSERHDIIMSKYEELAKITPFLTPLKLSDAKAENTAEMKAEIETLRERNDELLAEEAKEMELGTERLNAALEYNVAIVAERDYTLEIAERLRSAYDVRIKAIDEESKDV